MDRFDLKSQRINLRETFEQSKARRISEQEKAREVFNSEISKMLDSITEIGNKAVDDLKVAQEARKRSGTENYGSDKTDY